MKVSIGHVEVMELLPHPEARYAPADALDVPGVLISAHQLAAFKLKTIEADIAAHLEKTGQSS